MHRTVPIETSVECRRELAGWKRVGVAFQNVRYLVGVFAMDAIKCKQGKSISLAVCARRGKFPFLGRIISLG